MISKITRYCILPLLVGMLVSLPCQGEENKINRAELVWSQWDGLRHEIYTSSLQNGEWTVCIKLTDNNANNLHPVLDTGPDGTKWAFWTVVRPDGISVEYAYCKDDEWSEPQKLPIEQNSAITPSVLIDPAGRVWLVWAGNEGGNDDIYYTRYQGTSWKKPKVLHTANEVPDIQPDIAYNDERKIEVSWLGFRDGVYKKLAAVYTEGSKGWSPEQEKAESENEDSTENDELLLPSCMPADSQYFLKIY
ncbi:MAG: TolB family protein [Candidatus Electrothrix sp. YB6]